MSMVRKFSGGGHIQTAIGNAYANSALTFVCYAKQNGDGTEWLNSYTAGGTKITMGIEGGVLKLYKAGASGGPSASSNWALYVATKAAGTVKPLFYLYDFLLGEWVADGVEGSSTMSDGLGEAPEHVELGIWEEPGSEQFEGWMAADAIWKKVLSKAQVHELVSLGSVEAWVALTPDAHWRFDEALPVDKTGGGANAIAVTNTELVELTIPFPYGEGEEPPAAVKVKSGGSVVSAKRWVKSGGILVPA